MSLIDRIAQAITRPPGQASQQHEAARQAGEKRELEKRLRAGGLSRAEAKHAVAAHFRGGR